MACTYNHNGVEYSTREELKEALQGELTVKEGKSTFTLEGTKLDNEWQKTIIEAEAELNYGSTEMLSFNELDNGNIEVTVNGQTIEDITGNIKTLKNLETGEMEDVDISKPFNESAYLGGRENRKIREIDLILDTIQKESSTKEKITDASLKTKLVQFAENLGIKVDTLDNYLKDKQIRDNADKQDIRGLLDVFEKTIALANEGDTSTLLEEIAHLAILFNLDQNIVATMLEKVNETSTYQAEAEKYRIAYEREDLQGEALEKKVRMEVLGKILKEKIQDNFDAQTAQNFTETGIFAQLKDLWERFISKFQRTDGNKKFFREFGAVLDSISQNVLNNNTGEFVISESMEVYYNMDDVQQGIHQRLIQHGINLKSEYKNIAETTQSKVSRGIKLSDYTTALVNNNKALALNSFVSIIIEDIVGAQRKIEANKRDNFGSLNYKSFGTADITSTMLLTNNFEKYSEIVTNEISELKAELSNKDRADLMARITSATATFNSIKMDLKSVTSNAVKQEISDLIDNSPISESAKEEFKREWNLSKIEEDMWTITRYIRSIRDMSPILRAVFALVEKATEITRMNTLRQVDIFRAYVDKHNLKAADIKVLFDESHMINKFHTSKGEKLYEEEMDKATSDIKEKIKKLQLEEPTEGNQAKIEELEEELFKATEEVKNRLLEREFKAEYYSELQRMSPSTRSVIIARSVEKANILARYTDQNGKIETASMTTKDFEALQEVEKMYQLAKSEWHGDGSRKYGGELRTALELKKYAESFKDQTYELDPSKDFNKDREAVRAAYGETSEKYKRWLASNAVYSYSQEVYDLMNGGGRAVTNFTPKLEVNFATVAREVGLPESTPQQEVYEALLEKRKQLIAPYRVVGQVGEIDGASLDRNLETSAAIKVIYKMLGQFKTETINKEDSELTITGTANRAYISEYRRLAEAKDTLGLARLKENAGVKTVRGREIPTSYHYTTFQIERNGERVKKEYKGNFRYTAQAERSKDENPKFDKKLKGKTIQFNTTNNPELLNKEYISYFGINSKGEATKNLVTWGLRDLLLKSKQASDKKYNIQGKYFYLPQKAGNLKEIIGYGSEVGGTTSGAFAKTFLVDENTDEEEFGDTERTNPPKRYVHPLAEGHTALSKDIIALYSSYFNAADNFTEKNKILPTVMLIQDKINNTHIGEHRTGSSSNMAKMLEDFMSVHIYGNNITEIYRQDLGFLGDRFKGKYLSWGKVAKSLYKYLGFRNLGFNIVTPSVGLISASAFGAVESLSGKLVTKDNATWAAKEYASNMLDIAKDAGSINPKSKIKRMLEYAGVTVDINEVMTGVDTSVFYRNSDNLGFKQFEMMATPTGVVSMLSVFDSYRLVDGEFINEMQYKQKMGNKFSATSWNSLRNQSYYSYLKQKEDGSIYFDSSTLGFSKERSEAEEIRMNSLAQGLHSQVEGMSTSLDRAALLTRPATAFLGLHRGFFFNAINNRFRSRGEAWNEGFESEGNYRTIGRLFKEAVLAKNIGTTDKFKEMGKMLVYMSSMGYVGNMKGLEEFEKANLKRFGADLAVYATLLGLAVLLHASSDDDDDDKLMQYLKYVSTRSVLEQNSIMFTGLTGGTLEMLNKPVAGVDLLQSILAAPELFKEPGKPLESGKFEGKTKLQKAMINVTFYKNIYSAQQGYGEADLFFRNNLINIPEYKFYEK